MDQALAVRAAQIISHSVVETANGHLVNITPPFSSLTPLLPFLRHWEDAAAFGALNTSYQLGIIRIYPDGRVTVEGMPNP